MNFGGLLTMKKNTAMTDTIFLPEHAEKQRVLFFIIESTDPLCLLWEGKCFHRGLRPRMYSEKVLRVPEKGQQETDKTMSGLLLYSLDDLGDQLLKIELKLDDV